MRGRAGVVLVAWAWCVCAARAAVQLDPELAELAAMVRDNCVGDTGVQPALLAQVDGGAALPQDGIFKCYLKCTMEMAGMLEDDTVDVEAVLALLPAEMSARNADKFHACGTQRGADPCDTAYRTQLCWQQSSKDDYFLI